MPDTMIERVAPIIANAAGLSWLSLGDESRARFIKAAREAISAMRDPTELMLQGAAYALPGVLPEQNEATERLAWKLWHRMIDAALAEEG